MAGESTDNGRRREARIVAAVRRVAQDVALSERLPWDLKRLAVAAFEGGREKGNDFEAPARENARQEASWARLEREIERAPEGSEIRKAIDSFTVAEWGRLMPELCAADVDALLGYMHDNLAQLGPAVGGEKARRVFVLATQQTIARWPHPGAPGSISNVEISAPLAAVKLGRRLRNYSAVARALDRGGSAGWTRYRVKAMLDRMREDKRIRDYIDRRGPEPELDGDVRNLLRYWAGGKYARRRSTPRSSS